ncbi:MAG: hypothetical protein LBU50_00345, partial [Cellulomonas sp.]|nr:hypothetical protein [Cellulomonas sp.]
MSKFVSNDLRALRAGVLAAALVFTGAGLFAPAASAAAGDGTDIVPGGLSVAVPNDDAFFLPGGSIDASSMDTSTTNGTVPSGGRVVYRVSFEAAIAGQQV